MINKELLDFCSKIHKDMNFDSLGYPFDEASSVCSLMLCEENGMLLVKRDDEDNIIGCFAAILMPDTYNYKTQTYHETVWHADPDLPKRKQIKIMYELVVEAIRAAGETPLNIHVDSRFPAVGRLLERGGFKETTKIYRRC